MPDHLPSKGERENVPPLSASSLLTFYGDESARIRRRFEAGRGGLAALRERSDLVDRLIGLLYRELISSEPTRPEQFCLVALGGHGRQELFPYSDVDLLFLTENGRAQSLWRESIAALLRALWDLRMRVGHSTRTLADCGRLHRNNLEFNVSLLDCRYLAGDSDLFACLREEVIPHLVARDRDDLLRDLINLTQQRHLKYGNTIFHLEPNIKEVPGGLRDYHVCRWLAEIEQLERQHRWAEAEDLWPSPLRAACPRAFEFLAGTRCLLHDLHGRDDNQLSYEAQAAAAGRAVGLEDARAVTPQAWMRFYYRHARAIDRLTRTLRDEFAPARAGLFGLYRDWRSRLSNPDFAVIRGRIFARQPPLLGEDRSLLLRLFEMVARHGLEISSETERVIEQASTRAQARASRLEELWPQLQSILILPFAAEALRTMHRLGFLAALLPEFQAIDSLVIGDYYHRYTVDEHSFLAIQKLHELPSPAAGARPESGTGPGREWEQKFGEILWEVEQPQLLYLALLFHDVGKGRPESDHIQGSLAALGEVMSRLGLAAEDRETVRFLVANHLEMSLIGQRRDIFDPETIGAFADRVGTSERLKMLCLLTYADIAAVSREALTPWKAELLWQLYLAASNHLARSVDENRLKPAASEAAAVASILALLEKTTDAHDLDFFLEGFPRRYLSLCSAEEVAAHFEMARRLAGEPVQLALKARGQHHELTVVAADRPYLFASITGILAAWSMSIVKADAFANAAGIVVDTLKFVDLHRTLELKPSEHERFQTDLREVLGAAGPQSQQLLAGRVSAARLAPTKIKVATQVHFDDASSSHSTLLELIAQDRPGLLYQASSLLAQHGCNIEIALIDTEGQRAIDVFYLTHRGAKLDAWLQHAVHEALLQQL